MKTFLLGFVAVQVAAFFAVIIRTLYEQDRQRLKARNDAYDDKEQMK